MTTEELIKLVAEAYKNSEEGEADKNGNTKLVVLQKRFHLSSLKIQKLLVTAGVYEPVKRNTSYEKISRLQKAGKSADEIVKITGLSSAIVSACLPYERAVYNADQNGADISPDAERKRKQRGTEEMKRENTLEILQNKVTDDSFWKVVQEYNMETFISTEGQKYSVQLQYAIGQKQDVSKERKEELCVDLEKDGTKFFPKADVLSVLHNAMELKAIGRKTDQIFFNPIPALPYVYPFLVIFGIIPGDKRKFMTRRTLSEPIICCCCGRIADYTVNSYADLVQIASDIEQEERSKWDPKERERVSRMEASLGRVGWDVLAKRDNSAIRAFNKEGERQFCKICAETIRMALEDGDLPHSSEPENLSELTLEAAEAAFHTFYDRFPEAVRYEDRFEKKYSSEKAGDFIGSEFYFYKETDTEGVVHFFACYAHELPRHKIFQAIEIHKLTKAGKLDRSYTGTDYGFQTGLLAMHEEDEYESMRNTYIGFLELANKIRDALRNPTLSWLKGTQHYSNAVTIGNRQCMLKSIGEMQVVNVDEQFVQGRKWLGGQYGFKIDGILFTGEEVALMSSRNEEAFLQYRFSDPANPLLRAGEYLMPVQLGEKELVTEVSDLLNLFTADGRFISDHDRENFGILFEKTVLKNLKLYYDSNPRGYGKLAGMQLIKRLGWVEGTNWQVEQVRQVLEM